MDLSLGALLCLIDLLVYPSDYFNSTLITVSPCFFNRDLLVFGGRTILFGAWTILLIIGSLGSLIQS